MPDVIAEVTTEFLQAFADAWNRHDADAAVDHDGSRADLNLRQRALL